MADLTTLAAVKQWLPVSATTDDTLLARLVSGVSTWIQEWLSRTIASSPYTETLNGSGRGVQFLLHDPVTAVASVTVDGVSIPARPAVGQSGFTFDKDAVYLDGCYCFSKGIQNVVIQYTAGFASTPADLEQAAIELVSLKYRERDRIGLSSKGLAGEQTNFIVKDLPDSVKSILNAYKRVVPIS